MANPNPISREFAAEILDIVEGPRVENLRLNLRALRPVTPQEVVDELRKLLTGPEEPNSFELGVVFFKAVGPRWRWGTERPEGADIRDRIDAAYRLLVELFPND